MSARLTPTELGSKLYQLQRALEDRTTASEMLAESEATINRLRDEIGTDSPLVKALFTQGEPLPMVRHKKRKVFIRRVSRKVWLNPTLQALKTLGKPSTLKEIAAALKGTEGETDTSIVGSRLARLLCEKLVTRLENGRGLQYALAALSPSTPPPPIIQRHRGQVDSVQRDPHPWQVANRVAAQN